MYYVHLIDVGLFQSLGFSSQISFFLNHFVCHKRFPLSPTKICLLWEENLLKHKDDIEFKNANDVLTERTPLCVVHLDILKNSDYIISHGHSSRKWIMLRNSQRWACKDSSTSIASPPPAPLCICSSEIYFSMGKKKHLRSLEPGEWDGFWAPLSLPTLTSLSVVSYL